MYYLILPLVESNGKIMFGLSSNPQNFLATCLKLLGRLLTYFTGRTVRSVDVYIVLPF